MAGEVENTAEAGGPDGAAGLQSVDIGLSAGGLTFQNRIAVVALATAVVVLLGACAMFMLQQWRTERAHFTQNQAILARVAASDAGYALGEGARLDLQIGMDALKSDPRVRSAEFLDRNGRRMASFSRHASLAGASGEIIETRAPILDQGRVVGQVVLRSQAEGLSALLPRFIAMGGALFFVAAGIALFMGRWLAGRLTRPVDRLSRAMYEVASSSDFAKRVEHGENDEFGRLTEAFNQLLDQLNSNDLALRATMDALVEARDAAEAANVLKSHFLANMSHEIRTPLNGVLAMAQIMAMGELDNGQRDRLGVIRQSGEALLAILNDILDLSKIEAGRMELEDAEFDTTELARTVEAAHAPIAAKKGLAFSVDIAESARGLRRGDPARLQQILNNLVANAVKFTHMGEVRVSVDGEGENGADGLKVAVTDTGIGVAQDKLSLLFQKFSQVDSSTTRQYGGTGLGLAICRELAQLMGGSVWAESLPGVGSTFFVSLPLKRSAPAGSAAAGAAAARPADGDVTSLKILAAEDNQTNQLVLKTVMATFGLEVEIVEDGVKAVQAWETSRYDLILMDIQMPNMDGITATRQIRAREAATGRVRTPIVALSANAMTHQVNEYLAAGMDMHVAKPIQIAKLHEALQAVLNGRSESAEETAASGQAA